ncbi:LLM class F420-dependent oxidoreductase [Actinomycetospora termitidis]|uniref:LLM class F420-dependent oxidoreductase n=1 Tax=Actinomycetospora termitidis TaxID=3053470 RepID=A0ABT7MB19_9PSEU|nr:LLM class F420-dependent oxidoreductase [Actinomycetospora sp. Odt1-22]MDL5157212.1 LLM class F420-dependent oxidoreductase [Actinomycetospora sp. Odt1-22]
MDLRIFTEPQQGATYADLLRVARAAEDAGYDAFFRSDHYRSMGDVSGEPGPTDAWTTLSALAVQTERIRLGTLVTSATFRLPGPLAIQVAQADQMSGGRVELGLGAGWFEAEHTGYGIPFPSTSERFARLTEQLAIVTGLWSTASGDTFSFTGEHYTVVDSPALPKPTQQPLPVIVGGTGPRRTPALAARHAAEFNLPFTPLDKAATQVERVAEACREAGRDPASIIRSFAHTLVVGKDDAEVARRGEALGVGADQLADNPLAGTPAQIVDAIGTWRERTGATRAYLQVLDLADLDAIELVAAEVAPQLGYSTRCAPQAQRW